MKFLIDENLPKSLYHPFSERGLLAVHINDLKQDAGQQVSDQQINRYSVHKGFVVVTRDDDFVRTHVSRKVPEKLIYIFHRGTKKEINDLLNLHLDEALSLLQKEDLIEINATGVRTPLA